jgi:hypothetical protein
MNREQEDTIEDNPLVQASDLQEWAQELKELLDDKDFSDCMDLVIKIIAKPHIPQQQVAITCVRLSAFSLKFRTQYNAYMGFKKGTADAAIKKNMYRGVYEGIDKLVDSLKYLVK